MGVLLWIIMFLMIISLLNLRLRFLMVMLFWVFILSVLLVL